MKQTLKYIYERLLDSFRIVEGKYAITIALASAVIVFASTFIANADVYVRILAGGCIVFALISILYGFVALSARRIRFFKKQKPQKIENLMYYKTIIKFNEFDYVEEIKNRYNYPKSYKPDGFDYDLARMVISQAKVINLKFLYFNLSLVFLIVSILLGVGLVLLIGGV